MREGIVCDEGRSIGGKEEYRRGGVYEEIPPLSHRHKMGEME